MRLKLVIFAGTVGAGKSTHLRLLQNYLLKKGIATKATSLKSAHLFAHSLLWIIAKLYSIRKSNLPIITAINETYPTLFKSFSFLFTFLDALSIVIKDLINIQLPLKFGKMVLVEEYLPATVLDYFVMFRVRKVIPYKYFNFIYKLCARILALAKHQGSLVFFFDAPNALLYKRYKDERYFVERKTYLDLQRKLLPRLYSNLLKDRIIYVITSNPISQVQHVIRNEIDKVLNLDS